MTRHYCREIDRAIDALDMSLDALNEARLDACEKRELSDAARLLTAYNALIDQRRALYDITKEARARVAPAKPAPKPRARKA